MCTAALQPAPRQQRAQWQRPQRQPAAQQQAGSSRHLVRLYLDGRPLGLAAAAGRHQRLLLRNLLARLAQPRQIGHVAVLPLPNQACTGVGQRRAARGGQAGAGGGGRSGASGALARLPPQAGLLARRAAKLLQCEEPQALPVQAAQQCQEPAAQQRSMAAVETSSSERSPRSYPRKKKRAASRHSPPTAM